MIKKNKFEAGKRVKFVESYDGVHRNLKGKVLTVNWFHTAAECGHPEGRVKLKELQATVPYHSIEPRFLEVVS